MEEINNEISTESSFLESLDDIFDLNNEDFEKVKINIPKEKLVIVSKDIKESLSEDLLFLEADEFKKVYSNNPEETLRQLCILLFGEENYDISNNFLDYSNKFLIIKFPEFIIKNSKNYNHLIKDLYLGFELDNSYLLVNSNIKGYRGTLSFKEAQSKYLHSHLNSLNIKTLNTALYNSYINSNKFCTGTSETTLLLTDCIASINRANSLRLLLTNLKSFVEWESLEGIPYTRIENIKYENSFSIPQVILENSLLEVYSNIDKLPLDFIFLNIKTLKINNINSYSLEIFNNECIDVFIEKVVSFKADCDSEGELKNEAINDSNKAIYKNLENTILIPSFKGETLYLSFYDESPSNLESEDFKTYKVPSAVKIFIKNKLLTLTNKYLNKSI